MQTFLRRTRLLAVPMILTFLMLGFTSQNAAAGIVGTETVLAEQANMDREQVLAVLEREDVREKLVQYGVSPEEAAKRVAGLTDAEALELAQRIDDLPAGAAVVLLLVIIVLILLLR